MDGFISDTAILGHLFTLGFSFPHQTGTRTFVFLHHRWLRGIREQHREEDALSSTRLTEETTLRLPFKKDRFQNY